MMKFKVFIVVFLLVFMSGLTLFSEYARDYVEYLLLDPEKNISMDFENVDLIDVLKIFSQQSGLNFISSEAIRNRKITLYFDSVPLKEAFETLLLANNLTYEFIPESNIFLVKELGKPDVELETRVYKLRHARVSVSMLQREIDSYLVPGGGGGDEVEAEATGSGAAIEYVAIKTAIENVLSEVGKLTEDPRTNSIIITDMPSRFAMIDMIIAEMDVAVPQVLIEVEIIDTTKNLVDQMGIKWGTPIMTFTGAIRNTDMPFTGLYAKDAFMPDVNEAYLLKTRLLPNAAASTPTATPGIINFSSFTAALEFLSTDTDTKFLARPRIVTLSNETAEFKIARNSAIGKETEISESGVITEKIERADTGVFLRVTPQVDALSGNITMFVVPKVAEAMDSDLVVITATGNQVVKDPETRESRIVMSMKDGQTIVLSGLIRDDHEVTTTKLPFFGDLPFVGRLFRHTEDTKIERELIVFITPHVLKDGLVGPRIAQIPQREQIYVSGKQEVLENYLDRYER